MYTINFLSCVNSKAKSLNIKFKAKFKNWTQGCSVECLPKTYEALSQITNTAKEKQYQKLTINKKEKKREEGNSNYMVPTGLWRLWKLTSLEQTEIYSPVSAGIKGLWYSAWLLKKFQTGSLLCSPGWLQTPHKFPVSAP